MARKRAKRKVRRRGPPIPRPNVLDVAEPAQALDDTGQFHVHAVGVERELSEDLEEIDSETGRKDTGELYGIRTPHAEDRDLTAPEDQDAFKGSDEGETWLEALDEASVEGGPRPEEEVVVIDDSDEDHRGHQSTERDRPIADKGSGGPGGV